MNSADKKPVIEETFTMHFSKEELRLIKIGLFEISEYLNSPKLSELRQRVNSLMSAKKNNDDLPADSIFNNCVFQTDREAYLALENNNG